MKKISFILILMTGLMGGLSAQSNKHPLFNVKSARKGLKTI